jgi:hypothetical protein
MIKIIPNFLSYPLFKYLKRIIENEKGMLWNFNPRNLQPQITTKGSENYKLGKTLYCVPELCDDGKEVYDTELMPLFGVFQQYMMEHMQDRCIDETKDGGTKMVRMKINCYPSQERQIDHGIHNDIWGGGKPDPNVITSVFNFHTCNGSTTLFDKDKHGKYTKKVVVPSVENTCIMFNNPHPHFGTTQNDTQTRIVLNTNIFKAYVDPISEPDKDGKQTFEPIDDYF